jgi:hypothetical protein
MNSYKEGMISYVKSKPNEFDELIELALLNKQPYSWRAAWLLWSCMKENDKRLEKYIPKIIKILETFKDGHQRNLINILQKMKINEEHEGLLFDICVNIWTKTEKQASVRYKAFELIIQTTKRYPELYNEVLALTEDHYVEPLSEGIKRSMYRMIKSLK